MSAPEDGNDSLEPTGGERSWATEPPLRAAVPTPGTRRGPVTVLFSDLSGYTSLSESLDPEDLREVMTHVFGGIARIVAKYEGHVDKLLGDAAMVLFGVPRTHEDDAVRAIKAAFEIHEFVENASPHLESKTGRPLMMHSAISTGVVLTSEVDFSSADSALGDTVSLASRLLSFAQPGEIVCAEETRVQAQGYFEFEALGSQTVRGREKAVNVHRIDRRRELPATAHRIWGVRARLVGRREEWSRLQEGLHLLEHGQASVISICGETGTGKSRLAEEFRDSLDSSGIHWLESSSRAYAQNIPYHPFIESISRNWGIRESDSPAVVRQKVEANVARFEGVPENSAVYVGSLFGLDHPQLEGVDSEYWKSHVFEFVKSMLTAVALGSPTIIHLGDLHWADPSSLELLRFLLDDFKAPALFIATYRPPFSLFPGPSPPAGLIYKEIRLRNLSSSEAAEMLASLLDTERVPRPLTEFVHEKADGNPFYLEELVNSLIESKALVRVDDSWSVVRPLTDVDLPLTVLGVVSARLDRLDPAVRTVLQEASVIGRSFQADVLGRVTGDPSLDSCLAELQKLDFIRVRVLEPELEYTFKHALIQDVAYSSLMKLERRELHERVGEALETLFPQRLADLYETLALHFSRGISTFKAVDYLAKSAQKSFRRYAVEESYAHYREAYELLRAMPRSPDVDRILLRVLNGWAYVIYDIGNMAELEQLLESQRALADSLGTTAERAMFHVCLAIAFHCRERFREAQAEARLALKMGEELGDEYVSACACVWIAYGLSELGRPNDAVIYAERAIPALESDPIYIAEALSALGFACWTNGDARKALEVGHRLLEIGRTQRNTRAVAAGHWVLGEGHLCDGDFAAAARCFADSISASPYPWPSYHPRLYLAISYVQMGRYGEAEPYLREVLALSEERGAEVTGTAAIALLGVLAFANGEMAEGMKMLNGVDQRWREQHALFRMATREAILGQLYLNLVSARSPVSLRTVARNLGFLARNVMSAASNSERHFKEAIELCKEIGATGSLGEAYLGLSELYKATRKSEKARECAQEAIDCFQRVGIGAYLVRAEELLQSLE